MLYSSMYRVCLQGLKRPVVQQKVGACSLRVLATRWMSAMSYPRILAIVAWATGNLEWIPLWVLVIFHFTSKANMLYHSKCCVEESFVINNCFAISLRKIFTWKFLIFSLLYVHPELVLLMEAGIWKRISSFRERK